MRPLVFQVVKAMILELDFTTITTTNYILERLLKRTLIYNEVGISPIPHDKMNSIFCSADKLYSSKNLWETISLCRDRELITDQENRFLNEIAREMIRNGFSHGDSSKVLRDLPEEQELLQGNLANPSQVERIKLNPKTIPFLQDQFLEMFVKANASWYFDSIFGIMTRIEDRLVAKSKA